MSSFSAEYSPVCPDAPELGKAAILPWDSQPFGFNVGAYVPTDARSLPPTPQRDALRAGIADWMRLHEVELLSCAVPADAFEWSAWLGAAGFTFVDLALTAFARKLTHLPAPRITVRMAADEDAPDLERIAGHAFRFGRYHADPRFPKALADDRYQRWIRHALAAQSDQEFVFVSGPAGNPTGFIHATLQGSTIDLRLAAVDPAQSPGILGPSLFTAVLVALRERGARSAKARLSAGNTGILSLYSSLGFLFPEAEAVLHLHAPAAQHLLPPL